MSKIKKVYNKQYKSKMIKIEQYKLDPTKEGHQLMVSWKVNKRKPIIDGDDFVRPPKPKQPSLRVMIANLTNIVIKQGSRLDSIERDIHAIKKHVGM